MDSREYICICGSPKDWHNTFENSKKKKVCIEKFCTCKGYQPSRIKYDPVKWVQFNELKAVKSAGK